MKSYSNIISFPGLGIGEFTVNNVAFSVFGIDIAWYGIIITAGMIVAFLYASRRATKYEGINFDHMLDYAIYAIIFGVIGARLYYVIMDDSTYTLKQLFALRDGGLAIYGGIIGGAISTFIVTKIKKLNFPSVADAIMPGVMIAQAIGRWGNFMNGEAYGSITKLPWRMAFITDYGTICVHPTFLYESIWNVIGFILINLYYKKKKYNGEIVLMCVTWYGAGRMVIEGLRTDSLYLGSLRVSQLLAFICFVAGTILLIFFRSSVKRGKLSKANPAPVQTVSDDSITKNSASDTSDKENDVLLKPQTASGSDLQKKITDYKITESEPRDTIETNTEKREVPEESDAENQAR